jgi:hypothetical protein
VTDQPPPDRDPTPEVEIDREPEQPPPSQPDDDVIELPPPEEEPGDYKLDESARPEGSAPGILDR